MIGLSYHQAALTYNILQYFTILCLHNVTKMDVQLMYTISQIQFLEIKKIENDVFRSSIQLRYHKILL